jgi:hypothetical protein
MDWYILSLYFKVLKRRDWPNGLVGVFLFHDTADLSIRQNARLCGAKKWINCRFTSTSLSAFRAWYLDYVNGSEASEKLTVAPLVKQLSVF